MIDCAHCFCSATNVNATAASSTLTRWERLCCRCGYRICDDATYAVSYHTHRLGAKTSRWGTA